MCLHFCLPPPLFFTSKLELDRWCHSFAVVLFDQGEWTSSQENRSTAQRKRERKHAVKALKAASFTQVSPPDTRCFVNVLCNKRLAKTPAADGDITHVYCMEESS